MFQKMFMIWTLLFYFLPGIIFSQDHKDQYNGLIRTVAQARSDTARVRALLALASFREWSDSAQEALTIAQQAESLAEKSHYPLGIASSLSQISCFYEVIKKDYPAAIRFDLQAIHAAETHHLWDNLFVYYSQVLNCYFYVGDFTSAMGIAIKGLALAEQLHDKVKEAHYNNLVGFIYLQQQNGEEAGKYYLHYLGLAKGIKDNSLVADAWHSLGDAYSLQGDYRRSLAFHFSALNIYSRLQSRERMTYSFYKISDTYKLMKDYPRALAYALKAVALAENFQYNKYDLANYYINLGEIYRQSNDAGKAISAIHKGLNLARAIAHSEDTRDAYQALSLAYAGMGKYDSAYAYNVLYNRLKDSIINESSRREIERIHTGFQVAQKDREIALLHQQQQISQVEIARQHIIKNAFLLLFLLLGVMILLLYNRRQLQQKNRLQAERNKYHDQLFNMVMTVEDKERKRIAQDIHDTLGSLLSAAKLKLSALDDTKHLLSAAQQQKYKTAVLLLDDAAAELRNISHNIMPASLSRLGLIPALTNLFDNLSSSSPLISFTSHGFGQRLEETTEISIYRIILELVNNVIKHAAATRCTVQLICYEDHINTIVEDNGKGFKDSDKLYRGNPMGMGMGNILSRVEYLKGTLEIDSKPYRGTTVIIDVPCNKPSCQ